MTQRRPLPLPFDPPLLCAPVALVPEPTSWSQAKRLGVSCGEPSRCRRPAVRRKLAAACAPDSGFRILDSWTASVDGAGLAPTWWIEGRKPPRGLKAWSRRKGLSK